MNPETIARRLKGLRLESGLTVNEVARECEVADSTVRMWELGQRIPSDPVKVKLSKLFKQSVQTIFFD